MPKWQELGQRVSKKMKKVEKINEDQLKSVLIDMKNLQSSPHDRLRLPTNNDTTKSQGGFKQPKGSKIAKDQLKWQKL